MLCDTCRSMLYSQTNRIKSRSLLKLEFAHHLNWRDLQESVDIVGCYVCRILVENLKIRGIKPWEYEQPGSFLNALLKGFREQEKKGLYQLNFYFATDGTRIGSFILKQDDSILSADISRPVSDTTADPRVIEKARGWITECITTHKECQIRSGSIWHPNRLLDLQAFPNTGESIRKVRIVSVKGGERRTDDPCMEGSYVTLSHCWGKLKFPKLTRGTLDTFRKGLPLEDLPLTFQHAAEICRNLQIRWLWIDALCIIQDDKGLADWLQESATMDQVYANSYCNISATAAPDSSHGLFNARDTSTAWVESATVNTTGLLHGAQGHVRCTILDLSFWDKYVDNAPVNQRAWVYQERLLAPRVLHWCHNQIAFECRQANWAESLPSGLPHFRTSFGLLTNSVSHKSIDLVAARRRRAIRRHGTGHQAQLEVVNDINAIDDTDRQILLYELWKHWVEVYTKTALKNQRDRLIAFSGIARMMSSTMEAEGYKEKYIAGMWKNYLTQQLLWYVNEEDPGKYWLPNKDNRPEQYRAPTFSWAAVETRQGITFPVTENLAEDAKLLADVEEPQLDYSNPKDPFGMIRGGHIVIWGSLHPIELKDRAQHAYNIACSKTSWSYLVPCSRLLQIALAICLIPIASVCFQVWGTRDFPPRRKNFASGALVYIASGILWLGLNRHKIWRSLNYKDEDNSLVATNASMKDINRYAWRLIRGGSPSGQTHTIVYLDSPASEPTIFGPSARVYCLPILEEKAQITCLLLQAKSDKSSASGVSYWRVGLTEIPSLTRDPLDGLTTMPENRDSQTGQLPKAKSRICIV